MMEGGHRFASGFDRWHVQLLGSNVDRENLIGLRRFDLRSGVVRGKESGEGEHIGGRGHGGNPFDCDELR